MTNATRGWRRGVVRSGAVLALVCGLAGADGGAGTLDPAFGVGGVVVTDIAYPGGWVRGVCVTSDEDVVAVGDSGSGSTTTWDVRRYQATGASDTTFGVSGLFSLVMGGTPVDAALDAQGRIVIVGRSSTSSGVRLTVVRLTAVGGLDATFGSGGVARLNVAGSPAPTALVLQSDGKILVAGHASVSQKISKKVTVTSRAVLLVRLTTTGALDSTFDGDGIALADLTTSDDQARAVVLQSTGEIVVGGTVGGTSGQRWSLLRFTTSGARDLGFGLVTAPLDFLSRLAVDAYDRIVGVGSRETTTDSDGVLRRYSSQGALDAGFGSGGVVLTTIPTKTWGHDVAVQPDGRILAAAYFDAYQHPVSGAWMQDALPLRWLDDGSPDTTYGTNGVGEPTQAGDHVMIHVGGLALTPSGQAVLGGVVRDHDASGTFIPGSTDWMIARHLGN